MKFGSKLSWLIVTIGLILGYTGVSVAGTANRSASFTTPSPTVQVAGEAIVTSPLPSIEASIAPAPSPDPSPSPSPSLKPTPSPKVVTKPSPSPKASPSVTTQKNSASDVKYYTNTDGDKIQSPTHYDSAPSGATAKCGDGTYSFSASRRGTCSHHGGVAEWL